MVLDSLDEGDRTRCGAVTDREAVRGEDLDEVVGASLCGQMSFDRPDIVVVAGDPGAQLEGCVVLLHGVAIERGNHPFRVALLVAAEAIWIEPPLPGEELHALEQAMVVAAV